MPKVKKEVQYVLKVKDNVMPLYNKILENQVKIATELNNLNPDLELIQDVITQTNNLIPFFTKFLECVPDESEAVL